MVAQKSDRTHGYWDREIGPRFGTILGMISRRGYGEILRDLEALEAYLMSLGLRGAPNDRLRGLTADIRKLERVHAESGLQPLESQSQAQTAGLVWSLVEGKGWTEIFQGLKGYDPQVMSTLMRKAMKGPLYPQHETSNSNLARNTVFEMIMGSRFRLAGANLKLGGQRADLLIDHFGSNIYGECKRPQSEQGIEENIAKAVDQLRHRFASDPRPDSSAGFIAIDISKAVSSGSKWLQVEREDDIQPNLSNEAVRLHKLYAHDYEREDDPRVLGVLYYILAPVRVAKPQGPPLIAASQIDVFHRDVREVFPISGGELLKLLTRL